MGDIPFLPGPLQYFSYLAATSWPPGSESAMFGIGDAHHGAAEALDELRPELKTVHYELPSVLLGEAADAAEQQVAALDDALAALVDAEAALGDLAESFGNTLQDTKIEIWVGVAAAAAEITWALAMHGPTAGASLAWIPVIEAMTVAAFRKLVWQAVLRVMAMLKNGKTLLLAALREGHEELYWGVGEWLTTVGLQHQLLGHNNFDAEVLALTAVASGAGGAGGGAAVGPMSAVVGVAESKVGAAAKGVTTLFTVGVVGNVTGSLAVGAPIEEFPIVASALSSSITGLRGDGAQTASTTTSAAPVPSGPPGTGLPLATLQPGPLRGVGASEGDRRPFRHQWKPSGPQHGWRGGLGGDAASVKSGVGAGRLSHSAGVAELSATPGTAKGAVNGAALHADPADAESLLDASQQSADGEAAHKDTSQTPFADAGNRESLSQTAQQATNGDGPQKDPLATPTVDEGAALAEPPVDVPLSVDADGQSGIDSGGDGPAAGPVAGSSGPGPAGGKGVPHASRPTSTPRSPAGPSRQSSKSRPSGRPSKRAVRQERSARSAEGRSSSRPAGLPTTHVSATTAKPAAGDQQDSAGQPAVEQPALAAAAQIGDVQGLNTDKGFRRRQRQYREEYHRYHRRDRVPRPVNTDYAEPLDTLLKDASNPKRTGSLAEDLSGMYDGLYHVELQHHTHPHTKDGGQRVVLTGAIFDGKRKVGLVAWAFVRDHDGKLVALHVLDIKDKSFPGGAFYNSEISALAPYLRRYGIDRIVLSTHGQGVPAAVHADETWDRHPELLQASRDTIRKSARHLKKHLKDDDAEALSSIKSWTEWIPSIRIHSQSPSSSRPSARSAYPIWAVDSWMAQRWSPTLRCTLSNSSWNRAIAQLRPLGCRPVVAEVSRPRVSTGCRAFGKRGTGRSGVRSCRVGCRVCRGLCRCGGKVAGTR